MPNTNGRESSRFLSEKQLSDEYGFPVKTLQGWRVRAKGPKYRKLEGLVRYDRADIESWITAAPSGGKTTAA